MGVRLLIGKTGGTTEGAVLYDSVSGWPVGPIWDSGDAADQAEEFLQWMVDGRWLAHRDKIFSSSWHGPVKAVLDGEDNDPRSYFNHDLADIIKYWRAIYVDEQGWLIDTKECVCGSGHHHDDEGCLQCDCDVFVPSTEAGRIEATHG